eukprot:10666426-Ditylum_brightwellii.AAC.1
MSVVCVVVVVIIIVVVIIAISCVKPKTQPSLPPNHPKPPQTSHFPPRNNKSQQSAPVCLYRHQQDTIVTLSPPPWQCSAVIRRWCHSSGPQTRKLHHQRRWSAARAKPQQATLSL